MRTNSVNSASSSWLMLKISRPNHATYKNLVKVYLYGLKKGKECKFSEHSLPFSRQHINDYAHQTSILLYGHNQMIKMLRRYSAGWTANRVTEMFPLILKNLSCIILNYCLAITAFIRLSNDKSSIDISIAQQSVLFWFARIAIVFRV